MLRQQHPGQVRHLSAVVRLRLRYGQGLGHSGQEEACWGYDQGRKRLGHRSAVSEPVEDFEKLGHLGQEGSC